MYITNYKKWAAEVLRIPKVKQVIPKTYLYNKEVSKQLDLKQKLPPEVLAGFANVLKDGYTPQRHSDGLKGKKHLKTQNDLPVKQANQETCTKSEVPLEGFGATEHQAKPEESHKEESNLEQFETQKANEQELNQLKEEREAKKKLVQEEASKVAAEKQLLHQQEINEQKSKLENFAGEANLIMDKYS